MSIIMVLVRRDRPEFSDIPLPSLHIFIAHSYCCILPGVKSSLLLSSRRKNALSGADS